jgi:hypothetical protein
LITHWRPAINVNAVVGVLVQSPQQHSDKLVGLSKYFEEAPAVNDGHIQQNTDCVFVHGDFADKGGENDS